MGGRSGCGLVDRVVHEHRLDPRRHGRRRGGVRPIGWSWWRARPSGAGSSRRLRVSRTSRHGAARGGGRWSRSGCCSLLTIAARAAERAVTPTSTTACSPRCEQLDTAGFRALILIFAVLCGGLRGHQRCWRTTSSNAGDPAWRVWLNDHIVGDWLDGTAYHRGRFTAAPMDNPDQRIQEDIATFTGDTLDARDRASQRDGVAGVVHRHPVDSCRGRFRCSAIEIPRAMTFVAYLYVIVATRDRLPDRPAADPAELPERAPSTPRSATRSCACGTAPRAWRRSTGRAGRAGDPVAAVPGGDRQRLGHRLPEPEVPRLQLW